MLIFIAQVGEFNQHKSYGWRKSSSFTKQYLCIDNFQYGYKRKSINGHERRY